MRHRRLRPSVRLRLPGWVEGRCRMRSAGDAVLVIGGEAGASLAVSPSECLVRRGVGLRGGDCEQVAFASEGSRDWPEHPLHYQLACRRWPAIATARSSVRGSVYVRCGHGGRPPRRLKWSAILSVGQRVATYGCCFRNNPLIGPSIALPTGPSITLWTLFRGALEPSQMP
jgi:hypothetical protein